jgi:hypothetical protein
MNMVKALLTTFVRVNIPASAGSQFDRGMDMKKQTRGFWSWLLGGGWGGGAAG